MKRFIASLAVAYALCLGEACDNVQAQPTAWQNSRDGFTIRVYNVHWRERDGLHSSGGVAERRQKVLAFDYEFLGREAQQSPEIWGRYPGRTYDQLYANTIVNQKGRWIDEVDPREKKLTLDFRFWDAQAPAEARGTVKQALEWKAVPIPAELDQTIEVNRAVTSDLGAEVLLKSVTLKKYPGYRKPANELSPVSLPEKLLVLKMSYRVPAARYDMSLNPDVASSSIVDDRGALLNEPLPVFTGFSFRTLTPQFSRDDSAANTFDITLFRVPSADAKTVDIKLSVDHHSSSLKQMKWFHQIPVDINLQKVAVPAPHEKVVFPGAQTLAANFPDVDVVVEDVAAEDEAQGTYNMRLLFKNKDPHDTSEWKIRDLKAVSSEGIEYSGHEVSEPVLWKADGTPLQKNESGHNVWLTHYRKDPKEILNLHQTTKYEMTMQLEKVRRVDYMAEFQNVPLPARGKTLKVNRRFDLPDDGYTILRRVGWIARQSPDKTPEIRDSKALIGDLSEDLAIVLEDKSPRDGVSGSLTFSAVEDEQGRPLKYWNNWLHSGDLLGASSPAPGAHMLTMRAHPPFEGTTSLRVVKAANVYVGLGKTLNITLSNVVLPAFPDKSDSAK